MKVTTLPGKIKDYAGPQKHLEICKQVSQDALSAGIDVPDSMVDYIIRRFFWRLVMHMKFGNKIIVDDLGTLGMSPKEKKARIAKHEADHYKKFELKAKINKRREKNKAIKVRFKKFNIKRVELGQKPWKFEEWCKVFGIYKVPRYYRKGNWKKSREKAEKMKQKQQ